MKALQKLPKDYREFFTVDLVKNKKQAVFVNLTAVILAIVMIVPMLFHVSILTVFDMSKGFLFYVLRLAVLIVSIIAYIFLHEAVHGLAMKCFGTKKVNFGYKLLYAYAGSNEYYSKIPYLIIALAPIVLWGIVITVILFFVPEEWFWIVYFIQVLNVSGAAGDLYVTFKFLKFPKDILVRDTGYSMTVYSHR